MASETLCADNQECSSTTSTYELYHDPTVQLVHFDCLSEKYFRGLVYGHAFTALNSIHHNLGRNVLLYACGDKPPGVIWEVRATGNMNVSKCRKYAGRWDCHTLIAV
jgi:hypothetical protein